MKKTVSSSLIILLIIMLFSCTSCRQEKHYDKSVEGLTIEYVSNGIDNNFIPSSVQELYDISDYVVVAKPVESFSESTQSWANSLGETKIFEDADPRYGGTRRVFEVSKIIKGNTPLQKITVLEEAVSDGKNVRLASGSYIAKQGNNYLLFLTESNIENVYCTPPNAGVYDLDDPDYSIQNGVVKSIMNDAIEKYVK